MVNNVNHRMPVPRPGQVLGLVGSNGIGKSTALQVLAGKLKPNLGRFTVLCYYSLLHNACLLKLLFFILPIVSFPEPTQLGGNPDIFSWI